MRQKRVPPIAWVLSGATALAMLVLVARALASHGEAVFFNEGDAYLFRETARDLFGQGHAFAAVNRVSEIPYRYGRMGLPLLAWLLALGRSGWVTWSLIGIQVASIAAIPGLAAALLDEYGAPAIGGAVVLFVPGLLIVYDKVFADPLLIALILLAYLLDSRGRPKSALAVLAYAVLVKEVAALALLPFLWRALRGRDLRGAAGVVSTLLPYAAWCVWLRWRVGEFPFLAHTISRTAAFSAPGVGIHDVIAAKTPNYQVVVGMVLVTVVLGLAGAWRARRFPIAGLAAAYAVLAACLGTNALRYEAETMRVLALPQVLALLCIVVAVTDRHDAETHALSASNAAL
jgi:hypothetical protein